MDERRFFKVVFLANLSILGIILVGVLLWMTRSLVSPTLAALLVAYLLFPILAHCNKIGLPRWMGVTVIILLLGVMVSFTVSVVIPIIADEIGRFQAQSTTAGSGSGVAVHPGTPEVNGADNTGGESVVVVVPVLPVPVAGFVNSFHDAVSGSVPLVV